MDKYTVRLNAFEGPMDLLMHLIEKNKIDIYDIPMAVLTEQYMNYLEEMQEFDIEVASEFIVMAATLLQIKSRMMLPKPPKEKEEEEEEDPRRELVERILEYRRFRRVSVELDGLAARQERMFARKPLPLPVRRLPPEEMSVALLVDAFRIAMEVREEITIPKALVAPDAYSIQGKMEDILVLLDREGGQMPFAAAFPSGTRAELIVSFLALLELIKLHSVVIRQGDLVGDILVGLRTSDH